jgi:hypothetical protein
MSFTPDQLLLTPDKAAQLTAALANLTEADPLQLCCTEAEADVTRYTTGYVIAQESLDGYTRAIALWKAYTLAEIGVPEAIQKAYEAAIGQLKDIATGKIPNTPRTPAEEELPSSDTGGWGSRSKIMFPGDPA